MSWAKIVLNSKSHVQTNEVIDQWKILSQIKVTDSMCLSLRYVKDLNPFTNSKSTKY